MERVPAGSVFGRAELIYTLYDGDGCSAERDIQRLKAVVEGLQLLEDDYLGGLGTRGSGKVQLTDIRVQVRSRADILSKPREAGQGSYASLAELIAGLPALQNALTGLMA
jgi:CRISPR-associated protein Csm3